MKYSKKLKDKLDGYNKRIRKNCINYSYWKKLIKYEQDYVLANWETRLDKECTNMDKLLFSNGCFSIRYPIDTIKEIACINLNTLYKICKKLHKKLRISTTDYYRDLLHSRKYLFTSIAYHSIIDDYIDDVTQRNKH